MNKLIFALALVLIVPALRAREDENSGSPPQVAPDVASQPAAQPSHAQDKLPASIRPGHPLDPADVDILTGKRDREIEAGRRAAIPVMGGGYGVYRNYGGYLLMKGQLARW